MKTTAIIQARMASTRLPEKVLMPLCGRPMLWHIVTRLGNCKEIEQVIVATTNTESDSPIRKFCNDFRIAYFSGDENDLIKRYIDCAMDFNADPIIRITGDCPCVDPYVVDELCQLFYEQYCDYCSVSAGVGSSKEPLQYPDGLDAEIFSLGALCKADKFAKGDEREHLTKYIWSNKEKFIIKKLYPNRDYSQIKLSVDTQDDFDRVSYFYRENYREDRMFKFPDVVKFFKI